MKPPPNVHPVFVRIAEFVPAEAQARYWQFVALICQIGPDDDVLLLVEAMGFMTQIVAVIPSQMAEERQALEVTGEKLARRIEEVGYNVIIAGVRSTHLLQWAVRHERVLLEQAIQKDLKEINLARQHLAASQHAFFERLLQLAKTAAVVLGVFCLGTLGLCYLMILQLRH